MLVSLVKHPEAVRTHTYWTSLPGPLPLTTLQPKVYFRVGREEKEERKPKGENLRKGVREPRPPDTSFHQWKIHLARDEAFIKDKTLRQPIPFLASPALPSLPCPALSLPKVWFWINKQSKSLIQRDLGACDRAGPNRLSFRPGGWAEASRNTAMWV